MLARNAKVLQAEDDAQAQLADLETELGGMSNKDLRTRALDEGIDEDAVEDARDADAPKQALIALLMEKATKDAAAKGGALPKYSKDELSEKKLGELRKTCQGEEALDQADVDAADEEDDAKGALMKLLLGVMLPGPEGGDEGSDKGSDDGRDGGGRRGSGGRDVEKTPERGGKDSGRDSKKETPKSETRGGGREEKKEEPEPEPVRFWSIFLAAPAPGRVAAPARC